ncbi:MAG: hypothetical protein QMD22_00770 [archaeon]|nr:hypothetical protein [archaeon]
MLYYVININDINSLILRGTVSRTWRDLKKNLKEAIELYIESFGLEDLPDVSVNSYWTTVEVEAKVADA